ncbi:MAG: sialidase family protein [Pirellulaceae bacterium]
MIEPTIVQASDGRIAMVMRGSNSHDAQVPARKWISISDDQGETWSEAKAWGYSDGGLFYSPSSMSFLTRHSSGRLFWVGNLTPEKCVGNLPRYPVVIGELDPESLGLTHRSSVVTLDVQTAEDRQQGRLDLSHFDLLEIVPAATSSSPIRVPIRVTNRENSPNCVSNYPPNDSTTDHSWLSYFSIPAMIGSISNVGLSIATAELSPCLTSISLHSCRTPKPVLPVEYHMRQKVACRCSSCLFS